MIARRRPGEGRRRLPSENLGRLLAGTPGVVPCTPAGVLEILDHYGVDLKGAEAVVVGRSRIVGKPLAQLLLGRHATVTMCHTRTRDLAAHTRRAEISRWPPAGRAVVTGDMVRPGAVVVDVGVNRLETASSPATWTSPRVSPRARAITPVPGRRGADDDRDAHAKHARRRPPAGGARLSMASLPLPIADPGRRVLTVSELTARSRTRSRAASAGSGSRARSPTSASKPRGTSTSP